MKTVVVVQRLTDVADDFAGWLSKAGYQVRVCSGPFPPRYRCWASTRADCPLWEQADLMIYDPWLNTGPATHGSGALLELERKRHPQMPILIWGSGAAIPRDVAALERPGAVEILPLEITPAELVTAVEHLIGPSEILGIPWSADTASRA